MALPGPVYFAVPLPYKTIFSILNDHLGVISDFDLWSTLYTRTLFAQVLYRIGYNLVYSLMRISIKGPVAFMNLIMHQQIIKSCLMRISIKGPVAFMNLIMHQQIMHQQMFSDGARTSSLKDKCPDMLKSIGHLSWWLKPSIRHSHIEAFERSYFMWTP